ncbi:MAG: TolC family protein [Geobacteraceae bacterium]|nr:TolC family protein [Geobacteraceae bacterium]
MKRSVLVLLALLIPAQSLYAASSLTLDEALTTALKNHPQIVEAKENLKGAEARTGLALSNYYPQITVAADWNRSRSYLTALQNIKTTEVTSEAVYLKQTVYDFGRTAGAVDAARSNREAADKALTTARQDLTLRVKSAFYLLLATEKQAVAVREAVTARAQVYQQALEFYHQGIRAKVDVAKAESNLFAGKTALIRADNNVEIARMELANAMGTASLGGRTLAEPLPAVFIPVPERNRIQEGALRNRADLQQLSELQSAASANLRTAKGSYMPILSGAASVGYADREFPPTGNVWSVGLTLAVPLFSGFSSVEQVREARANISALEARQNNLKLQIIKEAETARLGVNEASARLVSTEKEVAAAGENQSLAEGRYREGVGSIIEVTDAQSQTLDAKTAHIQALYDYYTALARLDRAVGKE